MTSLKNLDRLQPQIWFRCWDWLYRISRGNEKVHYPYNEAFWGKQSRFQADLKMAWERRERGLSLEFLWWSGVGIGVRVPMCWQRLEWLKTFLKEHLGFLFSFLSCETEGENWTVRLKVLVPMGTQTQKREFTYPRSHSQLVAALALESRPLKTRNISSPS